MEISHFSMVFCSLSPYIEDACENNDRCYSSARFDTGCCRESISEASVLMLLDQELISFLCRYLVVPLLVGATSSKNPLLCRFQ